VPADAADARARLSARAVQAYTDMGSQYEALLSATSMTEFSDRLEFIGAITQTDSDLAAEADSSAQRADWAAQEYDRAVADSQAKADAAAQQWQQAQANLAEQEQIASVKLEALPAGDKDRAFYEGKVQAATFYAKNVLPNVKATAEILGREDTSPIDIALDAFATV